MYILLQLFILNLIYGYSLQELPVEDVYSPPLNIRVFDQRKFGYSPLVGNCTITSLKEYEDKNAPDGGSALQSNQTLFVLH